MNLTKELRDIRRKTGKTQKEFAQLLNIPQTTWASYEVGKANPPIKILEQLANMGYVIPSLSSGGIVGNNNTQTIGNNNQIIPMSEVEDQYEEIFDLIRNYATPKMLKEIKIKLLKIKEASDE